MEEGVLKTKIKCQCISRSQRIRLEPFTTTESGDLHVDEITADAGKGTTR